MEEKVKETKNSQLPKQQLEDELKKCKPYVRAGIFTANEKEINMIKEDAKKLTVPNKKDVQQYPEHYMEVRVYNNNVKEVQR